MSFSVAIVHIAIHTLTIFQRLPLSFKPLKLTHLQEVSNLISTGQNMFFLHKYICDKVTWFRPYIYIYIYECIQSLVDSPWHREWLKLRSNAGLCASSESVKREKTRRRKAEHVTDAREQTEPHLLQEADGDVGVKRSLVSFIQHYHTTAKQQQRSPLAWQNCSKTVLKYY